IGPKVAAEILSKLNGQIEASTRVKDLTEQQAGLLNTLLQKEYKVEGELRREVSQNIHRLIEIGSYRGNRHRRNLPARGQRTKTNSRTRRGRRKTVGAKVKAD
ncbi:MAG: 30S ribosomal protein S13, partial [Campylobacter sp.]|nr:30S ribosomal protein S13 [Campylobacter sp.]